MKISDLSSFRSVGVHKEKWTMEGCVDVLCEEWGRSRNCRKVMLQKSCEDLPYNIAFVCEINALAEIQGSKFKEKDGLIDTGKGDLIKIKGGMVGEKMDDLRGVELKKEEVVVGHSRLSSVVGQTNCAFIESVVVSKCLRGYGVGRQLMYQTELHARDLSISTLYLTTIDKESFYSHLGYHRCDPIISIGPVSKLLSHQQIMSLFGSQNGGEKNSTLSNVTSQKILPITSSQPHLIPPPPPPYIPLPPPPPYIPLSSLQRAHNHSTPTLSKLDISSPLNSIAIWMRKEIQQIDRKNNLI